MSVRRVAWAVNLPDGTPIIVEGAFADVDDETGAITLTSRSQEIINEVLHSARQATDFVIVPSIDLAHAVHRLVQAKHRAGVSLNAPLPPQTESQHADNARPVDAQRGIDPQTQDVIDRTLRLVCSQSFHALRKLGQPPSTVSLSDLRESPLGRDLTRLARIASGDETADYDAVASLIAPVLDLLFRPAGENQHHVPRSFWEEPLGKMLSRAKWRSVARGELISIGAAADYLGVSRPMIYRWIDDQTLNDVRDEMSGRIFVFRREIEQMKEETARMPSGHPAHHAGTFSNAPDSKTQD